MLWRTLVKTLKLSTLWFIGWFLTRLCLYMDGWIFLGGMQLKTVLRINKNLLTYSFNYDINDDLNSTLILCNVHTNT